MIPDRRLEAEQQKEVCRGGYDRSQFIYDGASDSYTCPRGKNLRKIAEVTIGGRRYHRYGDASACKACEFREECTSGRFRSPYRDFQNEAVQARMRGKLELEENRVRYKKRFHTAESPYGHAKRNLKFTHVMRRGREKVSMEMALLFMLHNIIKVAPVMLGSGV